MTDPDSALPEPFEELCGGYFHQDWDVYGANTDEIIECFIRDFPPGDVELAAATASHLVAGSRDNASVGRALDSVGFAYLPELDGLDLVAWLSHVKDRLVAAVGSRRDS